MKTNKHYFNFSKNNKEKSLDENYCFFNTNKDIKKYKESIKKLKDILIAIKVLKNKNTDKNKSIINDLFIDLKDSLNKYTNSSEFGCFINACDSTLDNTKKDFALLKDITFKYFENRILNEVVPEEWIQAILDTNSSRKKGKSGENKLAKILEINNFKKVSDLSAFHTSKKCYAFCNSKSPFSTKSLRVNFNIKINTKKQNKNLDLIFKSNKKIFILEAKHINTNGGGQDKQISELIEVLSLRESQNNIHYVSFLDGIYSNILLSDTNTSDKILRQIQEINNYLNKNQNSFWLNTTGFKELIKDIE